MSSKHQNGRPKNLNFAWKVRDKDLPSVHNSDCFDLIIEMVICFGFMDCCCCSCRGKKSSSMTILKMFDILVSASLHPFHKGSSHSSCLCLQIELKSFFWNNPQWEIICAIYRVCLFSWPPIVSLTKKNIIYFIAQRMITALLYKFRIKMRSWITLIDF